MRRLLIAFVTAAAAAMLGGIAGANHEGCNGEITSVGTGAATVYIDNRGGDEVWLYQESNGASGLQSGGQNSLGVADTCDHANPDRALY